MKFECPRCHAVYNGQLRFCPTCGAKIKYSNNDQNTYNNDSFTDNIPNFVQGCGCLSFIIFLAILWFMS